MENREYQRQWRLKNPEKAKEYRRRYRDRHPGKKAESERNWRRANRERYLASTREYRNKNRERLNATHRRWMARISDEKRARYKSSNKSNYLKRLYGIDEAEFLRLYDRQNGCCGICNRRSLGRELCVDHCHRTHRVRGLLCTTCNSALGMLNDGDPVVMMNLKNYIVYGGYLTPSELWKKMGLVA